MSPEERAVIKAALKWHEIRIHRSPYMSHTALKDLDVATQALKISRQPEHAVEPIPCNFPSRGGKVRCALSSGHDLPVGRGFRRLHSGFKADGSRMNWWEYPSTYP
jgi:hypothetical protein